MKVSAATGKRFVLRLCRHERKTLRGEQEGLVGHPSTPTPWPMQCSPTPFPPALTPTQLICESSSELVVGTALDVSQTCNHTPAPTSTCCVTLGRSLYCSEVPSTVNCQRVIASIKKWCVKCLQSFSVTSKQQRRKLSRVLVKCRLCG